MNLQTNIQPTHDLTEEERSAQLDALQLRNVVKAFVFKGEELLVLTRRPRTRGKGMTKSLLDFPGGIVEPGEELDQALLREIEEETRIDVELGIPMHTSLTTRNGRSMIQIDYLAEWVDGSVQLSPEHTHARWMTLAQLREMKDELLPLIEEAFALREQLKPIQLPATALA